MSLFWMFNHIREIDHAQRLLIPIIATISAFKFNSNMILELNMLVIDDS